MTWNSGSCSMPEGEAGKRTPETVARQELLLSEWLFSSDEIDAMFETFKTAGVKLVFAND